MHARRTLLIALRKLHLYLGVFCAPALLFFAVTGAMQTFSLHETTRGSDYRPPHWIQVLAQLHKKQTVEVVPRRPALAPGGEAVLKGNGPADASENKHAVVAVPGDVRAHNRMPLKIFFLFVSVSLVLSTLTGLYMTWRYERSRLLLGALLAAGTAVPWVLTLL